MAIPQFAYVFTGNKIIERKILQYQKIDDYTIFVRVEGFGPIVFDRGLQKVKKDKSYIALDKRVFGDEVLMNAKFELQTLNNFRNHDLQRIKEYEEKLKTFQIYIEDCKTRVRNYDNKILELKAIMGERTRLKNESQSN